MKIIGRSLDESQCLRSLGRKKDIRFNWKTRTMEILDQRHGRNVAGDLGNKSWGMIDFMVSQGWKKEFVFEFKKEAIFIW